MTLEAKIMPSRTDTRLAVDGGDPVIPRGYVMMSRWPRLEPGDLDRMLAHLRSGLLTEMSSLNTVHEFETEMAAFIGTRYALATNSGTAALHCALAGLSVKAGDEVVVPALTYIACAAAVIHHQGIPVFADIDPVTYNVTPETVERAITDRTRAIMVVHLHGLPADMDGIRAVAERHGLPVLEDFSQAVGARYHGRLVGGLGTVGAASLMAGKNLPSAGEGGILVTNNLDVRNQAARLKCFGEELSVDGSYSMLHSTMGWNYRINLLSAAMVSQQLFRLDDFNALRRASAQQLDDALNAIPGFTAPQVPEGVEHVFHMYRFRFDPAAARLDISVDQAHEGLKQVFWAEGLPLVEFQNQPLPGHDLLQHKIGYGRGCPWACHGRADITYQIRDYPGALQAIRSSLVVGYPTQAVLTNPEVVDAYLRCFHKLFLNFRAFERFGAELPNRTPWEEPARLF